MLKEFKDFVMRGNVLDLAVAVIIGGAFGKIVASLVNDIIMPIIGVLLQGVDFSTLASFGGTQMLSLGVTLDGVEDEVAESKLARAVPRLKAAEPRCHVHGLRTQSQVGLCRSLAVAAMNGVVVEEGGQARLELVRDGS